MKAFVLYDSAYGNTRAVAETIAAALQPFKAKAVPVSDFNPKAVTTGDLLIVGSPINGWRPTKKITQILTSLRDGELKGVKAAAFDTRVRLFIHGDAAKKISALLKKAGAEIISVPMPFYVKGSEGPLRNGETQKAATWARTVTAALAQGTSPAANEKGMQP